MMIWIIMMLGYRSIRVKMILVITMINLPQNPNPHLAGPVPWTTLANLAMIKKMSTHWKKNKKMTIMMRRISQTITFMTTHSHICTDTTRDKRGPKKTSRRKRAIMRKTTTKSIRLHRRMPSHTRHSQKMSRKLTLLNLY